ncbi:G2 and S phase-expressed protein 1 isoform X2 [Pipistrellus kuhlii]|nr:G2 and S phase-expressed protein 1 isoform X2 [Pipistrellus kuhlii]
MEGGRGRGGSDGLPAGQAGGAETEAPRKEGVLLLADEMFDFDLSLSSLSASEDDEVLSGPAPGGPRWSPLAGEAFVEVCREARLLALRIGSRGRSAPAPGPEAGGRGGERFIQESRLKTLLLETESGTRKSPGSLKRETYCLTDSPAAAGPPPSPRPALPAEPSPAPPPRPAVPQRKGLSRLPPPRAASARGRGLHAAEKPPKEKPASPSRVKAPGEQEPHGDRPPNKARAARDAPTLPASGSHLVQGKRSLPAPSKLGLKKTQLRPPGCAVAPARQPCARGSVSGLSARPCASAAAGRARPSVPADRARPPAPGQPGRAGAPAARAPPQPQTPEPGGGRPSPRPSLSSSQLRGPGSARRGSLLMSQTKAPPTPPSQFRVPAFPAGDSATPRPAGAWRPQSCSSAGRGAPSTPARHPAGPAARTPASTARASGLPTPASRRLSSLPLLTPNTGPRTRASPLCLSARPLPSEPPRTSERVAPRSGGGQAVAPGSDESSDGSLSPAVPQALRFSPEKSEAPVPESATTEIALDAARPPEEAAPREAVLVDVLLDVSVTPSTRCPLGDPPLIDAPLIDLGATPEAPVALGPGSRPLLDLLVNTPDTDRKPAARPPPGVGQLIDLCSPLIQLSPEADKENVDSPLLKF